MINIKSVAGPGAYGVGGFTVPFGEFEQVNRAIVKCSSDHVLGVADTAYSIHCVIATNIVTILVSALATVGAGPNAWTPLAAGNMAGLIFTVIADGE